MKLPVSVLAIIPLLCLSCGKGGGTTQPPAPTNPCMGVTVGVSGGATNPSISGASDGSINASASGGSGFTFSLSGGPFQNSGIFTGLSAGSYTVTAKSTAGCTGTGTFTLVNPAGICTGVIITVTGTSTINVPCEANTAIVTISASGGTAPYTHSINGINFQSSTVFNNVATGNYTVTAKDANGCTGSAVVAVLNQAAGPQFTTVRQLIQANCESCHNNTVANGGMNLSTDCSIVNNKDRIKARAVDGNPTPMPQGGLLPANERQKITDWINGGGKVTN